MLRHPGYQGTYYKYIVQTQKSKLEIVIGIYADILKITIVRFTMAHQTY
jgi:hypothetical protein